MDGLLHLGSSTSLTREREFQLSSGSSRYLSTPHILIKPSVLGFPLQTTKKAAF